MAPNGDPASTSTYHPASDHGELARWAKECAHGLRRETLRPRRDDQKRLDATATYHPASDNGTFAGWAKRVTAEREDLEENAVNSARAPVLESWTWAAEQRKRVRRCKVGIFDSGIGGLTVYMELKKTCPELDFVYFADTARQPYGPRSQEQVAQYSSEILQLLKKAGCGVGVIACNTATAATFDHHINEQDAFADMPILGTIPFAATAARRVGARIGVIATEGTCASGAYVRALGDDATVIQMPCPAFMPIVEEGRVHHPDTLSAAHEYMEECKGGKIDALIYGCTHYPFLAPVVDEVLSHETDEVKTVDPAVALSEAVTRICGFLRPPTAHGRGAAAAQGSTRFMCNHDAPAFAKSVGRVIGAQVEAEEVELA